MSESVSLPALGESVTEGTVTRWLKQVGDRVEVDEPLLEVSTDKVDTEIPSPIAGVIEEILVAEDETVEVGAALVRIGDGSGGGDAAAPADDAAPAESSEAAAPAEEAPAEQPSTEQPSTEQPASEQPASEQPAAEQPSTEQPAESSEQQNPDEPAAAAEQPTADQSGSEQPAPDQPAAEVPAVGEPTEAPTQEAPAEQSPAQDAPTESASEQPAAAEETPEPTPSAEGAAPVPSTELPEQAEATTAEQPAAEQPAAEQPAAEEPAAEQPAAEAPAQDAPAAESPAQETPAEQPAAPAEQPAAPAEQPAAPDNHAGYVTPIVRKLANEKGIDLAAITGTGVGGRIRKQDVLSAAEAPAAAVEPEAPAAAEPAAASTVEVSELRGTTVPMSRLRKVVAERAVISLQTSAQLTTVVEVDVTRVAQLRDRVKADFLEKTGTKLSFLPFFTLAAAEALRTYPVVNATTDGESIVYPDHEHISIAVDTERGLLTPVVRNAGDLTIADLATEIADLAGRTRANKLKPDELSGGTFTVTNTGSRGALFDTPLVFLPQSAILGTGIVVKKPIVVTEDGQDAIAIRSTVYLALSYDHRIVDGADAARFLSAVKARLEAGDFGAVLGI